MLVCITFRSSGSLGQASKPTWDAWTCAGRSLAFSHAGVLVGEAVGVADRGKSRRWCTTVAACEVEPLRVSQHLLLMSDTLLAACGSPASPGWLATAWEMTKRARNTRRAVQPAALDLLCRQDAIALSCTAQARATLVKAGWQHAWSGRACDL